MSDRHGDQVSQRLASFWIEKAVEEDSLGCSDCGQVVDLSLVNSPEEAVATFQKHAEEHHV